MFPYLLYHCSIKIHFLSISVALYLYVLFIQVTMAASSPTVLVPANMDPARFQVPQPTTTSLNYNTSTMMSSNVANSLAVSIASSSSQQNGIVAASHPGYSVVPGGSSGEGVGNVLMSPSHHHSQVKRNMHSSIILKTIRNTKKFVPRRFGEIMAFFK